jgi:hypothetical protein
VRKREGVAYVEFVLQPEIRWIEGHWEPPDAVAVEDLEQGPSWTDPEEAISWGRKRAPHVFLRLHRATFSYRYYRAGDLMLKLKAPPSSSYVIYPAGERHSTRDGSKRWPAASDERDADVMAGYGGDVYLVRWDETAGLIAPFRLTARWEALREDRMVVLEQAGPWDEDGVEEALDWARERAPVVLLCWPGQGFFEYFSAGDEQPVGTELPTWPRPDDPVEIAPHEIVEGEGVRFDLGGGLPGWTELDESGQVSAWWGKAIVGKSFPLDDDPEDPARWSRGK